MKFLVDRSYKENVVKEPILEKSQSPTRVGIK